MLAEHLTEVAMVVLAEVVSRVLLAVAVFVQFAYDVPAQVPAAARDRDGHHRAPSGGPQMSRWISKLVPLPTRPSTSSKRLAPTVVVANGPAADAADSTWRHFETEQGVKARTTASRPASEHRAVGREATTDHSHEDVNERSMLSPHAPRSTSH